MIASSLNMSSDNFLNDEFIFEKDNNYNSLIENNGEINAYEGGTIALIANRVENNGTINTPSGSSALLSGDKVKLSLDGNQLINYSIEKGSLNSLIENNHAINANDGAVILSSEGKEEVLSAVINNKGTIKAKGITKQGENIFILEKGKNKKFWNYGSLF